MRNLWHLFIRAIIIPFDCWWRKRHICIVHCTTYSHGSSSAIILICRRSTSPMDIYRNFFISFRWKLHLRRQLCTRSDLVIQSLRTLFLHTMRRTFLTHISIGTFGWLSRLSWISASSIRVIFRLTLFTRNFAAPESGLPHVSEVAIHVFFLVSSVTTGNLVGYDCHIVIWRNDLIFERSNLH